MHRYHKKDKRTLGLGAGLLAVAAALIIMGTQAKYVTSVPLTGKVTFSADLSEYVTLTEHKATRKSDGTYKLSTTEITIQNTYVVMPGVDIPKDPFITVTNKTDIPAYLYVEIVEENLPGDGTVTYKLTGDWEKLSIAGRNVYVYKGELTAKTTQEIPILDANTVYVSDQYNPASSEFHLKFYGYMAQKVGADDATTTFNKNF